VSVEGVEEVSDDEAAGARSGECARAVWHLWAAAEEAEAEAEEAGGDARGAELPWEPIRLRERERDARVAHDVSRFHVQQEQVCAFTLNPLSVTFLPSLYMSLGV
jgi:hypothetical protein